MSYDPIPAGGAGAGLFDQPTLFYLTNQTIIDEWAALANNVTDTVATWYRTVVHDALSGPVQDLDLEFAYIRGPRNRKNLVAYPPDTTLVGIKPVIGVGVTWPTRNINPAAKSLFSGVRCSANKTGHNARQAFIDHGGSDVRLHLARAQGRDHELFPLWRWITAPADWWTDLDAYLDQIVTDTLEVIHAAVAPLRAAANVPLVTGDTDPDEVDDVDADGS